MNKRELMEFVKGKLDDDRYKDYLLFCKESKNKMSLKIVGTNENITAQELIEEIN